jgi:hypothetical protein
MAFNVSGLSVLSSPCAGTQASLSVGDSGTAIETTGDSDGVPGPYTPHGVAHA